MIFDFYYLHITYFFLNKRETFSIGRLLFWKCCIMFLHQRETSHHRLHLNTSQPVFAVESHIIQIKSLKTTHNALKVLLWFIYVYKVILHTYIHVYYDLLYTHGRSAGWRSAAVSRALHPLGDSIGHAHRQPLCVLVQKSFCLIYGSPEVPVEKQSGKVRSGRALLPPPVLRLRASASGGLGRSVRDAFTARTSWEFCTTTTTTPTINNCVKTSYISS